MPLKLLAVARLSAAALVVAAVVTQFVYSTRNVDTFVAANFFSFFTIESNVVAAAVLVVSAVAGWRGVGGVGLSMLRGAAALYMTVTGIVYSLLLSGLEEALQTQVGWVNAVLHYVMPIVVLVDFLVDRSVSPLTWVLAWTSRIGRSRVAAVAKAA